MFLLKCFRKPLAFLKCLFFWRFKGSTKASKLRYFFVFFALVIRGNICLVGNRGIGEKENRVPGGTREVRRTRETWEQANKRTGNRGKGVQGNKGLGGARKQEERGTRKQTNRRNRATEQQGNRGNRRKGELKTWGRGKQGERGKEEKRENRETEGTG